MKKLLVAGNWKMNTNLFESQKLAEYIRGGIQQMRSLDVEVMVAPPFTSLETVKKVCDGSAIMLGAQNCHPEPKGAYTGETSVRMLRFIGCSHIIVGHSERREYFNETNELVNEKAKAIVERDLKAVVCIGETLDERKAGKTFEVLETQLRGCSKDIPEDLINNLVIAYEPVWAIGTGVAATPEQVDETHNFLRELIVTVLGSRARDVLLLYGGSMNPGNADTLLRLENVNGGLIGGASIDPEKFLDIINIAQKIVKG